VKTLNLIITTKNKKSLNNFLFFFYKNTSINCNYIAKTFQKKLKKTVITILKSPHVNKTAQEQFEIRYISKQLTIATPQMFKFLIFLKKLKMSLFPDIKIKIKSIINNQHQQILIRKKFNMDNFAITNLLKNNYKIQNMKLKQNKLIIANLNNILFSTFCDSKKLLKVLDVYGK